MEDRKILKYGSVAGLILTAAVGFVLYLALAAVPVLTETQAYTKLIDSIELPSNQLTWFLINWT